MEIKLTPKAVRIFHGTISPGYWMVPGVLAGACAGSDGAPSAEPRRTALNPLVSDLTSSARCRNYPSIAVRTTE